MRKQMLKMAVVSAVGTILLAAAPAAATGPEAKMDTRAASVAATVPARDGVVAETTHLQPFTYTAEIPVGSDLASIRFEGIKAVKVATERTSIADQRYCAQGYREPGGSMYCPSTQDGSPMPAYRITYSYNGPAIGSDEYGNTHFTFSVTVRPLDVSPAVLQMISTRKMNRAAAAEDFKLTTYRGYVPRVAIDEANSLLCAGNYVDGLWTHTDRNCEDKVTFKTVATPSDYITVRVDPAARMANLSAASSH